MSPSSRHGPHNAGDRIPSGVHLELQTRPILFALTLEKCSPHFSGRIIGSGNHYLVSKCMQDTSHLDNSENGLRM